MNTDESMIAIVVTARFDCLNVLLDVLKNNFKRSIKTHVFCNLSNNDIAAAQSSIDMSLVDEFYHFADDCFISGPWSTYIDRPGPGAANSNRAKFKREQPMRLLKNVFDVMSAKNDHDRFIYTECDVFPLDESAYMSHLDVMSASIHAYITDMKSGKTPHGMIVPSPIYIKSHAARLISNAIAEPINGNKHAFEGMLMSLINQLGIDTMSISKSFANNIAFNVNRMRETETTHQHDIMNLKLVFESCGITNGDWVKNVIDHGSTTFNPTYHR